MIILELQCLLFTFLSCFICQFIVDETSKRDNMQRLYIYISLSIEFLCHIFWLLIAVEFNSLPIFIMFIYVTISSIQPNSQLSWNFCRAKNPVASMSKHLTSVAFAPLGCIWSCKVAIWSPILEWSYLISVRKIVDTQVSSYMYIAT